MADSITIENHETVIETGDSSNETVVLANTIGAQVAHTNTALDTLNQVAKANTIDADWEADKASYMGDGEDIFIPRSLDSSVFGWYVFLAENGERLVSPEAFIPRAGGGFEAAPDLGSHTYFKVPTGTGVGVTLRATQSIDDSETAGSGEQRGLTLQLRGLDVEPAEDTLITLVLVEAVSSPAVGRDGRDGDGSVHVNPATISGTGSQADPFTLVNPYTTTEKNKLAGIEDNAKDDQTPTEIKDALEGLAQGSRLSANFIDDLPTSSTGLTEVDTDGTLTGDGTSSDPLKVAEPYTTAERNKLATVDNNAEPNRTFGAIAAGLNQLSDLEKLRASAIRDLPGISVEDEGTTQGTATAVKSINFKGDNVAATVSGDTATVTVSGGTGGLQGVTVQEEGTTQGTASAVNTFDFRGAEVTAAVASGVATITVAGDAPTKKEVFDQLVTILHSASAALGIQLTQNNTLNTLTMSAVTPGAKVVSDDQIRALFSTFTYADALTNDATEHVQRVLNLLVGGDWVDSESLTTTNDPTMVPAVAESIPQVDWTENSIRAATYGLRFTSGIHVANGRFGMRIPKVWLETNTLTRVAWAVGALSNDVDSFSDIVRYPVSSALLIASDATYNYYGRNTGTDKPAGAQFRPQYDVPAELDPDITVPQVPRQVSTTERTAGTEEDTRLWSPDDVKEAIDALGGAKTFASLTDTPNALVADQYVRGASDGNTLVFSAASPTEVGNARGRLVGRTTVLPTALVARGTNIAPNPGVGGRFSYTWNSIASGYAQLGPTAVNINQIQRFFPPLNPPSEEVIGLWAVAKVGTVAKQTLGPIAWGPAVLTEETAANDDAITTLLFQGGGLNDGLTYSSVVLKFNIVAGYRNITLEGNGTTLPPNSTIELYEAVVRGAAGADGSTSRAIIKFARPAAAVNITTPVGSTGADDQWSAWTMIESLPAITAEEAGEAILAGDAHLSVVTTPSTGGGDRLNTQYRLVRTRAAVDTVLVSESMYGPRNLLHGGGTSQTFSAATREASGSIVWTDTAQAGDVYKLEARVVAQATSGTREVTFDTTNNGVMVFASGGGEDVAVWAQEDDTTLIPNAKTGLWTGTQTELAAVTKVDGVIYFTTD